MDTTFDEALKAIAHPLRRQILQWLKTPEDYFPDQPHPLKDGVCAGQIQRLSGLSPSSVSAHLKLLQSAGLIRCQKIGQWHFLSRDEPAIRALLDRMSNEID